MSIKIEIELFESITIDDIIHLSNIRYGCFNESSLLKFNETSAHTMIYRDDLLCRGIDVSIEEKTVYFQLLLPSSKEEIQFMYEVIELLCQKYDIKEFIRNDEYILIKHISHCIDEDVKTSENVLFEIKEEIGNRLYICYCLYHPISLSIQQLDEFESLEDFAHQIHQLQSLNAYYEIPYFYKSKQDHVIGMYFAGVNEQMILPINPVPIGLNHHVDDWFIQIDGIYRLKYEDFISHIQVALPYDATHIVVEISQDDMYELVKYHYDLSTGEYKEMIYWNKVIDDGRTHSSKVERMDLETDEMNGYNHMAVYLYWMIQHDFLSDQLLRCFSDIKEYVHHQDVDIRELIKENECFMSQLRLDHFNQEGKAFSEYCYRFNTDGFPHLVDMYAKKILGEEKYHCDEYKDEAYLFMDYNDTYIEGLSEYIDELYEAFKKINRND